MPADPACEAQYAHQGQARRQDFQRGAGRKAPDRFGRPDGPQGQQKTGHGVRHQCNGAGCHGEGAQDKGEIHEQAETPVGQGARLDLAGEIRPDQALCLQLFKVNPYCGHDGIPLIVSNH